MPLSEKVRIEIYLPDLPVPAYGFLLETLQQEFTQSFGGATLIRGVNGTYLSQLGVTVADRVNLLYTDTNYSFQQSANELNIYTDELRDAAFQALNEEAILIVAYPVYHSG